MNDPKSVYFRAGQPTPNIKSEEKHLPIGGGAYYTFPDENKDGRDPYEEEEEEEIRRELIEKQKRKKFKAALVHDLQGLQTPITSHGRFTEQSQELLLNIHRYFKAEKETKTFILPTKSVLERCSLATGLSQEMLKKFLFEEENLEGAKESEDKVVEKVGDENLDEGENEPTPKKTKVDEEEKLADE